MTSSAPTDKFNDLSANLKRLIEDTDTEFSIPLRAIELYAEVLGWANMD